MKMIFIDFSSRRKLFYFHLLNCNFMKLTNLSGASLLQKVSLNTFKGFLTKINGVKSVKPISIIRLDEKHRYDYN